MIAGDGCGAGATDGVAAGRERADGQAPLSVSQALQVAKGRLEGVRLVVEGEVSELSDKPGYKAVYFTLADKDGALPCLIWKNDFARAGIVLRRGMLVQVSGNFSLYAAKGRMNFVARSIRPAGEGALRMQVAMLAKKLQAEGLMDPSRKKALPKFMQKIAVVTSPRGKAVHDVLRTLRRRAPQVEVCVCGVPVEGAAAPDHICEGLRVADASDCEAILLVRGGGSYEDLMPFNDEKVARTVAACAKPVITGIGHEPDNSIADMVGDLRCSTPTAAAEAATTEIGQLADAFVRAEGRISKALAAELSSRGQHLAQLASRPVFRDPNYVLAAFALRLDSDGEKLAKSIPNAVAANKAAIERCAATLAGAAPRVCGPSRSELDASQARLTSAGAHLLDDPRRQMAVAAARLEGLSPLAVLGRGYAIAYGDDGHVLAHAADAHAGDGMEIMMQDGKIACTVQSVQLDQDGGKHGGAQ